MLQYQDKLLYMIDNYSPTTFPHSIILNGEKGCGKHMLVSEIAAKYNLNIVDITEKLNLETLTEISLNPNPTLYLINGNDITIKEQNVILKFLEEPNESTYIIVLIDNINMLLTTIINRCIQFDFERYSDNALKSFNPEISDDLLELCRTPGDVIEFSNYPIIEIKELCTKIFDIIKDVNISNILKVLPDKIAFENEQTKFNVDLFFRCLHNISYKRIISGMKEYDIYLITAQLLSDMTIPRINKRHLYENYLIRLKQHE